MTRNGPTTEDAPRRDLELFSVTTDTHVKPNNGVGKARKRVGNRPLPTLLRGNELIAVAGHLRERSREPVQTHLARRGWRSDEGQRLRAVHALRKPERRTISPAPMSLGMGTGSALGWFNLTTCDSSG